MIFNLFVSRWRKPTESPPDGAECLLAFKEGRSDTWSQYIYWTGTWFEKKGHFMCEESDTKLSEIDKYMVIEYK